ncbi:preprotein translocase subunit SecG [Sphingomonas sp.]|uniref:preprotein translocase subunit SecG n=1 Tax=Sphingomonas sp. TaxID=28214 RepID=UPI003B3B56FD
MLTFLLVVHAIVAASLVAVILMQRSEGGGLASSGSPAGLMSARGAADFLTRTTAILATIFVVLSIGLAVLVTMSKSPTRIDTSLARSPAPVSTPATPAPTPAPADNNTVPLAQ